MRPPEVAASRGSYPRDPVVPDDEDAGSRGVDVHPDDGMTRVDDCADPRRVEGLAKRRLRACCRLDSRRFARERDAELGIAVDKRQRARDQLAGLRGLGLLAGLTALREREYRERRRRRQAGERAEREKGKTAVPSPRVLARPPNGLLRLVARLPAEHRRRKDVMEDLPAPRLVRAEDAVVCEYSDDPSDVVLGRGGELREIGCLVRDLHPRGRHEMVEEPRRRLLLRRCECSDRALEMIRHDLARSTEPYERLGPQCCRALRALREDVVEDLPSPDFVRAEDAMLAERLQNGTDSVLGPRANPARSAA